MINFNFDEVKIVDDDLTDLEIIKQITDDKKDEEPFHLLDVGNVLHKHQLWLQKFPRIHPYYAVKCSPNSTVIKTIAALGGNFDCASKREIIQVISLGIASDRIIYAHPIKFPTYIEYAKKVGVAKMTVDTEDELIKIKNIHPEAKIIIRIRCDCLVTTANLGQKFGCEPKNEAVNIIKATLSLGFELIGFSFHAGSPCGEATAICRGIQLCNYLIDVATSMGCETCKMIDIGGGIPGERDFVLDEFSGCINETLESVDPSVRIIAEPGRYYVTSAFLSAANVVAKKTILKNGEKSFMYYMSDGVYGSFNDELLHIKARHPHKLGENKSRCNATYSSTIWGPTCDSYDAIIKDEFMPEFNVGEWVAWTDMGDYSTCVSSEFNGFMIPKVYPVIRKRDSEKLFDAIRNKSDALCSLES